MLKTDIHPEARAAIDAIIKSMLHAYKLRGYTVRVGDDEGGDEAIFIDINYEMNDLPFDTSINAKLVSAVSDLLLKYRDDRFPYIYHRFQDGQKITS